jgi:hypothetical protein
MGLYFRDSAIPELAALSESQLRVVKDGCMFWLRRRLSYQGTLFGVLLLPMLAWNLVFKLPPGYWIGSGLLLIVSLLVIIQIHNIIWRPLWRPEIKRWIQLHGSEIEKQLNMTAHGSANRRP